MEWLSQLLRRARTKTGPMRDLRTLVSPLVSPAGVVDDTEARAELIIRSVSTKQRPRRR